MTIQTVNIGTVASDGTGDSARTSFDKINQNFTDPANGAAALVQTSPTDATAGRLMAVGAFGLGSDTLANDLDVLSDNLSGFLASNTSGSNLPDAGNFTFIRTGWIGGPAGSIIAVDVGTGEMYVNHNNGASWQGWKPIYTGANLNPNVFGGLGIGDVVATGIASTATILNVFLPISGVIAPSSITVTGTFSIFDITGAGIAGGVTPVLGSISSNKVALVQFTGITGLTVNSAYTVRSDNSGSSIEVNF